MYKWAQKTKGQRRIQRFSEGGGATPKARGANLLFGQMLLKTAWKWRKLDREEVRTSKILLCRSATEGVNLNDGSGLQTVYRPLPSIPTYFVSAEIQFNGLNNV